MLKLTGMSDIKTETQSRHFIYCTNDHIYPKWKNITDLNASKKLLHYRHLCNFCLIVKMFQVACLAASIRFKDTAMEAGYFHKC